MFCRKRDIEMMMVLVDGDRHGDGYVTPIVCKHYNEQTGFWFYLSGVSLSKSTLITWLLQRLIGQLSIHLHNVQTINNGRYVTSTVTVTVNK